MANTQTFTGDGTTTSFYFTFPFFGVNDIKVSVDDTVQTSDDITVYPTTTPGDAPDVPYTGGRIDFATAPASGAVIKVWRDIEIARHIDYQPTEQPQSHQLNQDINQCIEILKEQSTKISVLDDLDMDVIENVGTTVSGHIANTGNPHSVTIAQIGALSSSTKYGASLVMSMDASTYVVTVQLKDQDGNALGNAQTIDLPMESVVVSGSYDSDTKKVILTLKNGSTVDFSVADLISGLQTEIDSGHKLSADLVSDSATTNKFVTATDITNWNGKANSADLATVATTGAYTDLTGTPTIPTSATDVNAIPQLSTMPTAASTNEGEIVQFVGTTDATYTNGYFYKSVENSGVYSWTSLDVQPSSGGGSLPSQTGNSGKFLTTDGTDASWGTVATVATTGAYSDLSGTPTIPSTAADVNAIPQLSTLPTAAAGNEGQVVQFVGATGTYTNGYFYTSTYDSGAGTYSWVQTNVQPAGGGSLPSQAGNSGKFLTTDGTDASWGTVATVATTGAYSDLSGTPTIPSTAADVNAIPQLSTMPTAASTNEGEIVQFVGTTDATYTNGYFYKSTEDSQTPGTYSWVQTNVQPAGGGGSLPSQTGNSGKFLTTDGTDASWATISALQNTATGTDALGILATTANTSKGVAIGVSSQVLGSRALAIGAESYSGKTQSIAIGWGARADGNFCIQLGAKSSTITTNSDEKTFKVCLGSTNYLLMSKDGTIPTDRYTTTPSVDGTYVPTLTISSGTATRSWAATGLVAYQAPSAQNDYTWYRKYADGWVEQGGRSVQGSVTLPVEMADTNYTVLVAGLGTGGTVSTSCSSTSTTQITIGNSSNWTMAWQVSGIAA